MSRTTGRALAAALLLLACAKETRSLVPIDIRGPASADLAEVTAEIGRAGASLSRRTLPWNVGRGETLKMGIYLPSTVTGPVEVGAVATDKGGRRFASSARSTIPVEPGKAAAVVTLVLEPSEAPPDGGATSDGGTTSDGGAADAAPPADAGDASSGTEGGSPPPELTWRMPENIEKDIIAPSFDPGIAIHPTQGHLLVAWRETGAVKVSRYDAGTKMWAAIRTLDDRGAPASDIHVLYSASGQAMVLWYLDPNSAPLRGVWASRSTDGGTTWSPPLRLHDGPARYSLDAAISQAGDVRVVWDEADSLVDFITLWSAAFKAATGTWINVAAVAPPSNYIVEHAPRVAMEAGGAGAIAYLDPTTDSEFRVRGLSFNATDPLPQPDLIGTSMEGTQNPTVAVAPGGKRVVAMWTQGFVSGEELWMNERAGGAWKGPTRLVQGTVRTPALAIDKAGTVTAVWTQYLVNGKANVVSARQPAGQGWSAPMPLETTNLATFAEDRPHAALGVDGQGNVHAAWTRRTAEADPAAFPIVVRSFLAGAWQPEVVLDIKNNLRFSDPRIAVADSGAAALSTVITDPMRTGAADAYNTLVSFFR
jgi:hypothetical protein